MIHFDKSSAGTATLAVFSNSETKTDATTLKALLTPLQTAFAEVPSGDVYIVVRNVPGEPGERETLLCAAGDFLPARQMLDRAHSTFIATEGG